MASKERIRSSSTTELLHRENALDHPQLSFLWRFFHSSLCILGGVMFLLGSAQYFPSKQEEARGSAMFVIGASCFFIADSMDLYVNYSTAINNEFKGSSFKTDFQPNSRDFSILSILTLPLVYEEVMNAFMGTIGSLCYLLGCILFIPELLEQVTGDVLFIPGSVVLIISQGWKVLRAGRTPPLQEDNEVTISTPLNSTRTRFSVSNMCASDVPLLCADISLGLGAVAFLIGSVLFLPQYDTTDSITVGAVYAFLAGSVLFISTGLCVFYKYFCTASVPPRVSSPSSGYSSVCSDCTMQQSRQSMSSLTANVV